MIRIWVDLWEGVVCSFNKERERENYVELSEIIWEYENKLIFYICVFYYGFYKIFLYYFRGVIYIYICYFVMIIY